MTIASEPATRPALRLAWEILRPFWPLALFSTVVGSIAGIASAGFIAAVNRAFHTPDAGIGWLVLTFAGLGVVAILGEVAGNIGNSLVGQKIVAAMRLDLADKILSAPIAEIERIKSHRLLAALDSDVRTISVFSFSVAATAVACAIVIGCFVYLAFLSPAMLAITALAAVVDIAVQFYAGRKAGENFDAVRGGYDDLQKHYRTIIEGAKELRINRERRTHVRSALLRPAIEMIRDRFVRAMSSYFVAKGLNSAVFFATLFCVLTAGLSLGISGAVLSGFVLVLLFVRGPIDQIVSTLPMFAQAAVALRRVRELSERLTSGESSRDRPAGTRVFDGNLIELKNVRYEFPPVPGAAQFTLGPLDLTIRRGEMLFISGANGSGKTTLIKLLLALYRPGAGELRCDGIPVDAANADDYRQLFSTVFFDYHLFENILGGAPSHYRIAGYLARLEIAHKVSVAGDAFSTTDLSTGQRKRLALVHVLLEDRPLVVLDEWAADQDPAFRAVFYKELLPEMKRQGKTLIVVSHDDRYFATADRLLKLEDGRIIEDAAVP